MARAIFNLGGADLDMTMVDEGRFPNIVGALREAGLDPMTQRIPVAPASHYVMGGVVTDLDGLAGERLYAVGECACTGLHGANRLASNSLSECFVFGRRAALKGLDDPPPGEPSAYPGEPVTAPTRETREAVWRLAGLERNAADLDELSRDPHPLARLVAISAKAREETRGSHARAEFPELDPAFDHRHTHPRPRQRDAALRDVALEALLIDWGGVLTTSMLDSFDAFQAREGPDVRRAFKDDPSALADLECGRIDLATFERRMAAALGVEAHDLARRLTAGVRPDEAMRAAVAEFHAQGIRTALVSNSWRAEDYDLDDLFDAIVLSGELGIRKPDPAIYVLAAERVGVAPNRCVFVDDLGGNLKPAKALGMTTIRHVTATDTIAQLKPLLRPVGPS